MIVARGLSKRYGEHQALAGLDLEVRPGEVFALFGGNGAGKSTTVNLFLGFIPPSGGQATVAGHDVAGTAAQQLAAKRNLAYVAENVMLYGHASPRENLAYFAELGGQRLDRAALDAALAGAGLDASAFDRPVRLLSKGMRQKCGLAIAFARQAPALFLDEPFSGLDPISLGTAAQLIRQLNDSMGLTSIFVSHELEQTFAISDHVIILANGKVASQGTPAQVRVSTDPLVFQYVNGLSDGPVRFHYPGSSVAQDFGAAAPRAAVASEAVTP